MNNSVTIHVQLLNEGSPVARPTQAIDMGNGLFKVLPIPNYDKAEEVWEYPPGSIVHCEKRNGIHGEYLYAVAKV